MFCPYYFYFFLASIYSFYLFFLVFVDFLQVLYGILHQSSCLYTSFKCQSFEPVPTVFIQKCCAKKIYTTEKVCYFTNSSVLKW